MPLCICIIWAFSGAYLGAVFWPRKCGLYALNVNYANRAISGSGLTPVHVNSVIPNSDWSQMHFFFPQTHFKGKGLGCVFSQNQQNLGPYSPYYILGYLVSLWGLGIFTVLTDDSYQISPPSKLFLNSEFHFMSNLSFFGHSEQWFCNGECLTKEERKSGWLILTMLKVIPELAHQLRIAR